MGHGICASHFIHRQPVLPCPTLRTPSYPSGKRDSCGHGIFSSEDAYLTSGCAAFNCNVPRAYRLARSLPPTRRLRAWANGTLRGGRARAGAAHYYLTFVALLQKRQALPGRCMDGHVLKQGGGRLSQSARTCSIKPPAQLSRPAQRTLYASLPWLEGGDSNFALLCARLNAFLVSMAELKTNGR